MIFIENTVKIKRLSSDEMPKHWKPKYIKLTRAGHVSEFVEMSRRPKAIDALRVSKDFYIKPSEESGEVYAYQHASDKSGCQDSVRRSLAALRLIINANCSDPARLSWVTLTYAENMTDTKQLYHDYKAFWLRFSRWCAKQGYQKPEYIAVAEPQGRGAWHLHCIWIWSDKAPFIDNNSVLWKLWKHGFTKIKAVRTDCDNLGAYFSAYLADMTVEEYEKAHGHGIDERYTQEKQVLNDDGTETPKRIVKGARLKLYPVGMQIYRASKGVVRPTSQELTPEQAEKEKASAGTLTFSAAVAVLPDCGSGSGGDDSVNIARSQIISKSYYNAKRKKSQAGDGQDAGCLSLGGMIASALANRDVIDPSEFQ